MFVLGFVVLTAVVQVQDLNTEANLRQTSEALFPAAQNAEKAEAAYQRMIKGFNNAVLVQDTAALARPAEDGKQAVEILRDIVSVRGLPSERANEARQMSGSIHDLATEAVGLYASALADPASLTPEMQAKLGQLTSRINTTEAALQSFGQGLTQDLQDKLRQLQTSSSRQRRIALFVCIASLLVAGGIVHLTIRRSIAQPIYRAVTGLRQVTEESSQVSGRMAQSGHSVAQDAQEQAACIQQTSASLERIAGTTHENADRAGEADRLMREAKATVTKASQGMDALADSMSAISQSSKQVANVLKSIDEIAFQTNILALNAAVEAARAGQAGTGFSVVANEVRSLAQRAAEAAGRSGSIIEKTIADVGAGVDLVSATQSAFREASSRIASGTDVVAQIALSSNEQARGVASIREAIGRIETVTQHNAANAKKSAEAASEVDTQVQTTHEYLESLAAILGLGNAR